jgi:hypothetical protein
MLEAMVYLISRTVPEDLQPAVVVLAFRGAAGRVGT